MKKLNIKSTVIIIFSLMLVGCGYSAKDGSKGVLADEDAGDVYVEDMLDKATAKGLSQTDEQIMKVSTKGVSSVASDEDILKYEDFMGYYLHYEADDRFFSDMIVTVGKHYISLGWWMSDYEVYEVIGYSIHENILTVEYETLAYGGKNKERGSFNISYQEEGNEKVIAFDSTPELKFYSVSHDEAIAYEFSILEFIKQDVNQ